MTNADFDTIFTTSENEFAEKLLSYLPDGTQVDRQEDVRPDFKDVRRKVKVVIFRYMRYAVGVYIPSKEKGFIYKHFINGLTDALNIKQ